MTPPPPPPQKRKPVVALHVCRETQAEPGRGAFAAMLVAGDRRKEMVGAFRHTTKERLEIQAAVMALQTLKVPRCQITLYSDTDSLSRLLTLRERIIALQSNYRFLPMKPHGDVLFHLHRAAGQHEITFVHTGEDTAEREELLVLVRTILGTNSLPADLNYEIAMTNATADLPRNQNDTETDNDAIP